MIQKRLRDNDIHFYLANLLVDFTLLENLYRLGEHDERRGEYLIDMLQQANETGMPEKKSCYKHVGDFSLFMLGMFPEYIARRRSALPPRYYSDFGRIGYKAAGRLESDSSRMSVYRKLAEEFETCVESLHLVREYTTDPSISTCSISSRFRNKPCSIAKTVGSRQPAVGRIDFERLDKGASNQQR